MGRQRVGGLHDDRMAVAAADGVVRARNDELVNPELVRRWLAWGLAWLLIFPTIGVLVSTKFNYPDFLGGVAWLTFGRLRPIHVNGVIWGAFSTLFIALCLYLVPRLAGSAEAACDRGGLGHDRQRADRHRQPHRVLGRARHADGDQGQDPALHRRRPAHEGALEVFSAGFFEQER